jgi:protocatechuate 3,4-dioxygenase beta subunit
MKKAIGRNILIVLCMWVLSACGGLSTNAAGLTPTATAVDSGGAVSSPTAIIPTEMVAPTGTADSTQAVVSTTDTPQAVSSKLAPGHIMAPGTVEPLQLPTLTAQPQAITCTSPAVLTPAETEGPYFKSGSPEQSALGGNLPGAKLTLTGYVLGVDCQPVAHAMLDFWQADASGTYDNTGYSLRGHLFTDASGRFQLETVVPGLYPGRTEHIHVKVQAPGGPLLTTQLFFPKVAQNDTDGIFDSRLLMTVQPAGNNFTATYDFVVALK